MSNAQWFYSDAQKQQQGPLTFDQIQQMAASGQIQPTTLIWNESLPSWTAADQIPGVFNAPGPAAPAQYANQPMGQPAAAGGQYPIPYVKRTSFGLWIGAYVASLVLIAIAIATFVASAPSTPDYSAENRQMREAETLQEIQEAQEAIDRKSEEFANDFSGESAAGMGLGAIMIFLSLGISIFAAVYGYIILYRSWHILQPGGARTTPGQAVGFCFIPIFSLYWIFNVSVGWATDWTRIRASYANLHGAPEASSGMFIAALVCMITVVLSPIGIILMIICIKQMCDTINFFADSQGGMTGANPGNMPNFV